MEILVSWAESKIINAAVFSDSCDRAHSASLSSCCLRLSAAHSASNLVHMVYIWGRLMMCGRSERMRRGGGIRTGIAKICHFIPRYWMLHSLSQGQGFLCRKHYGGLRGLSLTFKAHSLYCCMACILYMTSFTFLFKKVKLSMPEGKKTRPSVQLVYIKCCTWK